uniref:Uncharacterized protein ORF103_1 n=1 Tax=Phaeoceros laevis TaxID=37308 RepID=D3J0J1_9EMBR|nr:hypothetical protein PhlaMp21 [Phaeoceros laevis]ACT75305.1 hypothetical protein PhlaMp21 [Phaeoceros laevis]
MVVQLQEYRRKGRGFSREARRLICIANQGRGGGKTFKKDHSETRQNKVATLLFLLPPTPIDAPLAMRSRSFRFIFVSFIYRRIWIASQVCGRRGERAEKTKKV